MRLSRIPLLALVLSAFVLASGCKEGEAYLQTVAGAQDKAGSAAFRTSLMAYATALQTYQLETGRYPASLGDLPEVRSHRLPAEDPWGAPLTLRAEGSSYEIRSPGPDGRDGTEDDIVMRDGQVE